MYDYSEEVEAGNISVVEALLLQRVLNTVYDSDEDSEDETVVQGFEADLWKDVPGDAKVTVQLNQAQGMVWDDGSGKGVIKHFCARLAALTNNDKVENVTAQEVFDLLFGVHSAVGDLSRRLGFADHQEFLESFLHTFALSTCYQTSVPQLAKDPKFREETMPLNVGSPLTERSGTDCSRPLETLASQALFVIWTAIVEARSCGHFSQPNST